MRYLCESVIPKWFWFFRISAIISSYCVQKLIASSRWSNFTHKDTEKNRKIQNFKIVLNCRETDARVSSAKIRGLQSLKLENDGMGTGLKWNLSWNFTVICSDSNDISTRNVIRHVEEGTTRRMNQNRSSQKVPSFSRFSHFFNAVEMVIFTL